MTRWFIKRKTGTGTVEITIDNGTTWQDVTSSIGSTTFGECLESLTVTNPTIGIRIVTSGDAVYVGNAECHQLKSEAKVLGSAPIVTAASSVTTTAVASVYNSANMVDTIGGIYAEVTLQVAQNILSTFLDVSGSTFRLNDGTNTATSAWVTNTAYQVGSAWDATAATMAINVNGVWSSNATYDGTLLSGALDLYRSASGSGIIRNILRGTASNLAGAKAFVDGYMV
jgi:hypothetical protein